MLLTCLLCERCWSKKEILNSESFVLGITYPSSLQLIAIDTGIITCCGSYVPVHVHMHASPVHMYASPVNIHLYASPVDIHLHASPVNIHLYPSSVHVHLHYSPVHKHLHASPVCHRILCANDGDVLIRISGKRCHCHGHSDRCTRETGENCACQNNTETDCQAKDGLKCWQIQVRVSAGSAGNNLSHVSHITGLYFYL